MLYMIKLNLYEDNIMKESIMWTLIIATGFFAVSLAIFQLFLI